MTKNDVRLIKLQKLLFDANGIKRAARWCAVDIYNRFTFDKEYQIDSSVESYKVENMPEEEEDGTMNYWTNQAEMETILCVIVDGELQFFDENIERIDSLNIQSNTV